MGIPCWVWTLGTRTNSCSCRESVKSNTDLQDALLPLRLRSLPRCFLCACRSLPSVSIVRSAWR